jgi:hypothetical protein
MYKKPEEEKKILQYFIEKSNKDQKFLKTIIRNAFEFGFDIGAVRNVAENDNSMKDSDYDEYMKEKGFSDKDSDIEVVKESGMKYKKIECKFCKKITVFEKEKLFSMINILLAFITSGLWLLIMIPWHILFHRWTCTQCSKTKRAKVIK